MDSIKIKGTGLDRSIKVGPETKRFIRSLRKEEYTYKEIASFTGLSQTAIRYHCLGEIELNQLKEKSRTRKKDWYYSLSQDKRSAMGKKWAKSCKEYKEELLSTKIDNMNKK